LKSIAIKLTLILSAIFFTACSNMQIGFEEDSIFYTGPSVEVQLSTNDTHTYKLSIDEKYDYITLIQNKSIKFNLETGSNVISIRRNKKEVKHITIDAKGKEKYYLEIVADASGTFEINRVEKLQSKEVAPTVAPIVAETKEQPTAVNEQVKAPEAVKEQASPVTKKELPVVEEESETTFSYSREDGE